MLKLDRVSKFYSANGVVTSGFSKVSLNLDIGEFVAITGESGSGKSTLLNVISGLDSYEEGEMYISGMPTSGYDSADMENYRKRYIGNIFQTFNLINNYTVYQNVEMVLLLSGYKHGEVRNRVNEIIDKVGLSAYRRTKASKLSGGQKQRVAIARALAKETPIIVADEPTGNLDVASAAEIINLLADLAKDKLIVIVTHNYEQVEPYVTRKITMHDGRVVEDKRIKPGVAATTAAAGPATEAAEPVTAAAEPVTEAAEPVTAAAGPVTAAAAGNAEGRVSGKDDGTAARRTENLPTDIALADNSSGIKEARHDGLSFGNTLRLGIRNTFSLLAKFLLLFFVLIFLSVGTFSSYSNYVSLKNGNRTAMVWSRLFNNSSPERVIVTREDRGEFTAADYAKLESLDNIREVVKNDLMLDTVYCLTDVPLSKLYYDSNAFAEVWMYGKSMTFDNLQDRIVEGRMPHGTNEIVLLIRNDAGYMQELIESVYNQELFVSTENGMAGLSDSLQSQMKIVGYGYWTEEEEEAYWNDTMYYDCFICTDEKGRSFLDSIVQSSLVDLEIRTYEAVYSIGQGTYYELIPWEELEPGQVYIPTAMAMDYPWGGWSGEQVEITSKGVYEEKKESFDIAYHYGEDTYQWILGISKWSEVEQGIYMNPDDIMKLYPRIPVHQISLLMDETLYAHETIQAINDAGYTTLYINEAARHRSEAEDILNGVVYTGMLVVLLGVLFFISYFIIKLIFKSRNIYFSTVRMLGGSKGACSGMLLVELLTVFHLAFIVVSGALMTIKAGIITDVPSYLNRLTMYLEPKDFLVLYGVIFLMTILLSTSYSRQMFRKTAINAYKEEV